MGLIAFDFMPKRDGTCFSEREKDRDMNMRMERRKTKYKYVTGELGRKTFLLLFTFFPHNVYVFGHSHL